MNQVIENDKNTWQLVCAQCKKVCATFSLQKTSDGEYVLYEGLTGQTHFPAEHAPALFAALKKSDLRTAHKMCEPSKERLREGIGIDAYCPACDRVYCSTHYNVYEIRDEHQFYEKTIGTCPQGHRRTLDD